MKKKYDVYVNACIEINETIEAEDEDDARLQAYAMIGHRDYSCDIQVTEADNE